MSRLDLFLSARAKSQEALAERPVLFPLESVIAQLDYLVAIERGEEQDIGPLRTMDMGQIAARDIETVDRELAHLIYEVMDEVDRMLGREF